MSYLTKFNFDSWCNIFIMWKYYTNADVVFVKLFTKHIFVVEVDVPLLGQVCVLDTAQWLTSQFLTLHDQYYILTEVFIALLVKLTLIGEEH